MLLCYYVSHSLAGHKTRVEKEKLSLPNTDLRSDTVPRFPEFILPTAL